MSVWDSKCCAPSLLRVSGNAFEVVNTNAPSRPAMVAASNYFKGKVIEIAHEGYLRPSRNGTDVHKFFENALKWMSLGKDDCKAYLKIDTDATDAGRAQILRNWSAIVNISSSEITITNNTVFGQCDILFTHLYNHKYSNEEVEVILEFVRQGGGLLISGHNWVRRGVGINNFTLPVGIDVTETIAPGAHRQNIAIVPPQANDSIPFVTQEVPSVVFGAVTPSQGIISGSNTFSPFVNEFCEKQLVLGAHYGIGRVLVFGHENIFTEAANSDPKNENSTFNVLLNSIQWLSRYKGCEVEYRSDALEMLAQKMSDQIVFKKSNFTESSCVSPLILDVSTTISQEDIWQIQNEVYNGKGLLVGGHVTVSKHWVNTLLEVFGLQLKPVDPPTATLRPPQDTTTDKRFLLMNVDYLSFQTRRPGSIEITTRDAFGVVEAANGETAVAASNYGNGRVLVVSHERVTDSEEHATFQAFLKDVILWMSLGRNCNTFNIDINKAFRKRLRSNIPNLANELNFTSKDIDVELEDLGQCTVLVTSVFPSLSESAVEKVLHFVQEGGGLIVFGRNYVRKTCFANDIILKTGIYITTKPLDRKLSVEYIAAPSPPANDSVPYITKGVTTVDFGDAKPTHVAILHNASFEVFAGKDKATVVGGAHYGVGRVLVFGHESIFTEAANSDPNDNSSTFNVLLNSIQWLSRHKGCEVEYRSDALNPLARKMDGRITMKKNNFNESSCISPLILDVSTAITQEEIEKIQNDVYNGKGLLVGGHVNNEHHWVNTLLMKFGLELIPTPIPIFPGPVVANTPRTETESFTVQVDVSYHVLPPELQGQLVPVWRPTGIYANASEPVRVLVPASMVNKNFQIQIGSHADDLSNATELLRNSKIVSKFEINDTSINAGSEYGGLIYTIVPPGSSLGMVNVTISGGYQAPVIELAEDGNLLLKNRSNLYSVPFGEMRGQKVIMTLPTAVMEGINQHSQLIRLYDRAVGYFEDLSGISSSEVEKTLIVLDVQTSTDSPLQSGYPIVGLTSSTKIANLTAFQDGQAWDVLKTLACQYVPTTWTVPEAGGDEICDLFSVYASEKLLGSSTAPLFAPSARKDRIDNYIKGGRNYTGGWKGLTAVETYLQLKDSFGWGMYKIVFPRSNNPSSEGSGDSTSDIDKWVTDTSTLSGYNLYHFYKDYWGWPVSSKVLDAVANLPDWTYGPE